MSTSAICLALFGLIAIALPAQAPSRPTDCAARVPGTPLRATNPAAPTHLSIGTAKTVQIEIFGHSENRGYHTYLQQLLDSDPPVAGVKFVVTNNWIGGHEAWRWATPGQRGFRSIDARLQARQHPMLALCLFSNNASKPLRKPDTSDANFRTLVQNLEDITVHLHDSGKGALMVYHSSHRYKPANVLPCLYERTAVEHTITEMGRRQLGFVKAGPEQHDLHWCCHPTCYARDNAHTNAAGDLLMAQAWHNLLVREFRGCFVEPFDKGTAGSGGFTPVLAATARPSLGNAAFGLRTTRALGGTALIYAFGTTRQPGPLLTDLLALVTARASGVGSGAGSHQLALPIANDPSLHGLRITSQVAARDPASAGLGLALSQGLEIAVCK